MDLCYKCGNALDPDNPSVEHIIPNALGGRLRSKNILCGKCNQSLGKLDKQLAEQLNSFMVILDAWRDRGDAPSEIFRDTVTQEEIVVSPSSLRRTGRHGIEEWEEDGKKFARITANDRKHYDSVSAKLEKEYTAKDLKLVTNSIDRKPTYSEHPLTKNLELNRSTLRAILKIAIGFYMHYGGERRYIEALVPGLELDGPAPEVKYHYPGAGYFDLGEKEVAHLIKLVGDPEQGILYCYIELFSSFCFMATLSTQYDGPAISESRVMDVLGPGYLDKAIGICYNRAQLLDVANDGVIRIPAPDFNLRIARLSWISEEISHEAEYGKMFQVALKESFEPGKPLTEEMIMKFAARFSTQYAPLLMHRLRVQENRKQIAAKKSE
jgi:hypothetical protein